jgi:hypothetical protein
MYSSCRDLSCNSSLQFFISILIYCMIGLRLCGLNFHMTYKEFFVIDIPYDLKFVIDIPYVLK